ncbi:MAG: hypothetical protein KAJ66_07310 [Candidatus Omnitrophica bacterium]|nr:hypothetical protein [Candidatus Omnitrophota bacterium]
MKKPVKILVLLAVFFLGLFFCRNLIVKALLSSSVRAVTGLELDIESVNLDIFGSSIGVGGLVLYNPERYADRVMVDVPEIYLDYEVKAILRKKAHFKKVRLYLRELIVVKDKDGELNLRSLKVAKAEKEEEEPARVEEEQEKKELNFKVDLLELKIDKVIYKDYSQGEKPVIKTYNVNIDESFEDIIDIQQFAKLILIRALVRTTISRLAGFDVTLLSDSLVGIVGGAGKAAGDALDKSFETGKDIGGKTIDNLEKTTKDIIKMLPFGHSEEKTETENK